MKILLIQPPVRDFYQTSIRTQPIGLAYLAASLRTYGYEVGILDCQTDQKRSVPIPPELSYLRDFYPFHDRSPFRLYVGFYHFGMGRNEIRQKIEESKADVFGISSSFTSYHGEALEIARTIKEWDRMKTVVMGGSHASCDPEGVLKSSDVDYVVLGEGEVRFPLLLERIGKNGAEEMEDIDGIGYRKGGEIRINPLQRFIEDLDRLPSPARDLFAPDRYRVKKKRSTMLITSRGCPHRCVYCSGHLVMGNRFRARSPEAIVKEMKTCREQQDLLVFDIEDDNFTYDRERAKRLLNLIIETFGEGTLELSAMNGISFASLDGELLGLMKKAGFRALNLSFVSADLFTRERMKRPKAMIEFDSILAEADRIGLNVVAYGILGMPGQTIGEMADTLIYLMGRRVLIGPSIYYPTPGTPLFRRCQREGFLPPHPSQLRSSALPVETTEFCRLDLATLFRLARVINFIKGKMDTKELDEGVTWRNLYRIMKEKANVDEKEKLGAEATLKAGPDTPCDVTWRDLLLLFLEEKTFFGLRKGPDRKLTVVREKTSREVLDCFFEKGLDTPILKSSSGEKPR
jgi:radical SAM superfamily enzyme YgiQ (UPF0313 family)